MRKRKKKWDFSEFALMYGKCSGVNCRHTARAGRRFWGTIVISREQTELSKTIPLFRKKNT